jgi:hypothetical protein
MGSLLRICCALLFLAAFSIQVASSAPSPHNQSGHGSVGQNWYMVNDNANVMDEDQETSAINDAYRLNLNGIPTQVVTENAALTQSQADFRATELRISHSIESAKGADDGLLVYLARQPYDSLSMVMSISVGANTLPVNGLDAVTLQHVHDEVMIPQLMDGTPARAIVYGLREMIYLEQYVPPASEGVNGWKASTRSALAFLGPLAAVAGIAWTVRRTLTDAKPLGVLIICGSVALLIGLLAATTHSTAGVLSAIALGAAVVWQAIVIDRASRHSTYRVIKVTPRPATASRHRAIRTGMKPR